jgi:ABC-type hemin transport system ATPase subunit
MVVIEHDMPLITGISDELVALEVGSVIARGAPDDVVRDPRVVEGYLGQTEEVIKRSGSVGSSSGGRRRTRQLTAGGRR